MIQNALFSTSCATKPFCAIFRHKLLSKEAFAMWIRKGVNETKNSDAKLDEISQRRARLTFFLQRTKLTPFNIDTASFESQTGYNTSSCFMDSKRSSSLSASNGGCKEEANYHVLISQYVYIIIFAKYVCHTRLTRAILFYDQSTMPLYRGWTSSSEAARPSWVLGAVSEKVRNFTGHFWVSQFPL